MEKPENYAEIEKWIELPDLEFKSVDNNSSIKTNFLLIQRNLNNLVIWLSKLKQYVAYLRKLIDVDAILKEIIRKLRDEKLMIPITYNLGINQSTTYTDQTTKVDYMIRRVDDYTVQITNLTNVKWSVDRLLVMVKAIDGTIVYPVIRTNNSQISLYFTDGLSTNYLVFMM